MTRRPRVGWGMMALVLAGAVLLATGCAQMSQMPPSGAQDPTTVAERRVVFDEEQALLAHVVGEQPLSTAVADRCHRGRSDWKIKDYSAWHCTIMLSWIVADDTPDVAELVASWKSRLIDAGCEPSLADFDVIEGYWETLGADGVDRFGEPYTVDRLPPVDVRCDGRRLGVTFGSPGEINVQGVGTYLDGELITDDLHDRAAVRSSDAPHVVALVIYREYHSVPWP